MTSNVDKVLRENIEKRCAKWHDLAKQKDWDSLVSSVFAQNAKILPPTGETIVGREAILAYFKNYYAHDADLTFKVEEVTGEGDWAYARCTYKHTQGSNEDDSGKSVAIWRKINNEYQVWADIWNSSKKV